MLAGRLTPDAAKQAISLRTAQLAKRQRAWFRHQLLATAIDSGAGALEAVLRAIGA